MKCTLEFNEIDEWEILTPDGFVNFSGVKKSMCNIIIKISFEDDTFIDCSYDHKFFINDEIIVAKDLVIGDKIDCVENNKIVKSINIINADYVYSPMNVESYNHKYFTNDGVIHKNCAFVPPNIMDEFIQSVLPIVSSRPDSKIIAVSTPNGTGNWYYETYHKALYNIGEDGWKSFRIDWWDVPGRDERWKQKKIAEFNNDLRKFAQEYGNSFLGSSQTLINARVIERYKEASENYAEAELYPIKNWEAKIWHKPEKKRTYIIGCDIAEGVGGDFSIALIMDVTDTAKIKVCASFSNNTISPTDFAYVLAKLSSKYNNAMIAGERNGIGRSTMDTIWNVYEMENILCWKSKNENMLNPGIFSHNAIKVEACIWAKFILESELFEIEFNDKNILFEMEYFEKKANTTRSVYQAVEGKHDDYMMSLIWALWLIEPTVAEYNFVVESTTTTSTGIPVPRIIKSDTIMEDEYYMIGTDVDPESVIDKIYDKLTGSRIKCPEAEEDEDSEFSLDDEVGFLNDVPSLYSDGDEDDGFSWETM